MDADEISFSGAGVKLSGTVMLPHAATKCPGLVLVGGSGPADRHNDGFFDSVSEHLIAHDAVGVLGHSEGGWVALRLCAQRRSIACLILNSCPAVSFVDAEVFALTRAGASPTDAEVAGSLLRELTEAAQAGHGYEHGKRIVTGIQQETWYRRLQDNGFVLDRTAWAQIREWGAYNPQNDLNNLTTPTLVILGADDPLVPVSASAQSYRNTATHAHRTQELAIFPAADHRLHRANSDAFAPGSFPSYLAKLSAWTKKHAQHRPR